MMFFINVFVFPNNILKQNIMSLILGMDEPIDKEQETGIIERKMWWKMLKFYDFDMMGFQRGIYLSPIKFTFKQLEEYCCCWCWPAGMVWTKVSLSPIFYRKDRIEKKVETGTFFGLSETPKIKWAKGWGC